MTVVKFGVIIFIREVTLRKKKDLYTREKNGVLALEDREKEDESK